ncbi:hypothetical protein L207DRAFT_574324 [Hyaloscypha variabilis F]|uniref:VOC domain-containing protein n=1 Tax=Hyaloscypha variabilis (strain UAMH 11265 / GT02V1 / F) TaxID=1149755 RepID=A0A2J6QSV2_HYAVF|nr:hypothetical protein L207DRAFT_574324 [Hyaloscypha variabilis F]
MSPPFVPEYTTSSARPPILFVTHLPSASSFYASILQPLGLQFLPPNLPSPLNPHLPAKTISNPVLNYGYLTQSPAGLKSVTVFSITQGRPGAVVPAKITLSASTEEAVREFWKKSALLNKGVRTPSKLEFLDRAGVGQVEEEGIVARTRDFDGNMLEAVYRARDMVAGYGAGYPVHGRREIMESAATEKEARRVLEWQEQVARSIGESGGSGGAASVISSSDIVGDGGYRPAVVRRADSYPVQGSERDRPMRLVRRETVTTEHYRRPEEGGRGISGKAVIGTLLGAAAGAAFAYAMVRSESPERDRRPAIEPRRASYGHQGERVYTHIAQTPRERAPARSYVSARGEGRPRYADVEYVEAAPRVHQIDNKSYVSQRPGRSSAQSGSRARSRSEAGPRYERPLTILPSRTESRARSPSQSQRSSYKTARERSPSRKTSSHVSTKSYHSHSTAKQSPPPPTSTIKIRSVPSERPSERERRSMHSGFERDAERARQVPLPISVASGAGYAVSVAPSDSVSSVGIKRERERLRERMSIRDGGSRGSGGW